MYAREDSHKPRNRLFAPAGDDGASLLDNLRGRKPDTTWKMPMPKNQMQTFAAVSAKNVAKIETKHGRELVSLLLSENAIPLRRLAYWKKNGIDRDTEYSIKFCKLFNVPTVDDLSNPDFEPPEISHSTVEGLLKESDNTEDDLSEAIALVRELMMSDLRDATMNRLKRLHKAL